MISIDSEERLTETEETGEVLIGSIQQLSCREERSESCSHDMACAPGELT